jgi:hypothetical protein
MKKIFTGAFIVLSLLSANLLKAQKDYVVTLAGDTLLGKIKKPLLDGLKFQEKGKKEALAVNEEMYKEYFIAKDSTHYVAVKLSASKKPEFLKCLVFGKIQLFQKTNSSPGATSGATGVTMSMSMSTSYWYAGFNVDSVLEIKTSGMFGSRAEREKNFYSLIESYPELLEDFKKEKDFSFEMLRSYIRKYNYYFEHINKETK